MTLNMKPRTSHAKIVCKLVETLNYGDCAHKMINDASVANGGKTYSKLAIERMGYGGKGHESGPPQHIHAALDQMAKQTFPNSNFTDD